MKKLRKEFVIAVFLSATLVFALTIGITSFWMLRSNNTAADIITNILVKNKGDFPLVDRNGKPEDVAKSMLYLADADFITGQVIPVNAPNPENAHALINYLLALVLGKDTLSEVFTFLTKVTDPLTGEVVLAESIYIDWGTFINAIINFLLVAFTLFVIARIASGVMKRIKARELAAAAEAEEKKKAEEAAKAAVAAEAAAKAAAEAAAALAAKEAELQAFYANVARQTELLEKLANK